MMRLPGLNALVLACGLGLLAGAPLLAQDSAQTNVAGYNLMPQPAELTPGEGRLAIDGSFRVALTGYQEPRLRDAAWRMIDRLTRQTGIPLDHQLETDASKATFVIACERAGEVVQSVKEDESYTLEVTPPQARLSATTPVGVLRGIETFLQLVALDDKGFGAPGVTIHDHPRFAWRGLMMDVSRHFMPVDVVERNLDAMAAVKLNVFHWHLSDDQGFRVESKQFPKLQELGSDGLYYTQAQVKEVIDYARDRGIRVVPEFDMPGHATAMLVGYPQLGSAPGPYKIERHWGIFDPCLDPTNEAVYTFLDTFIGEMAGLFPDDYFHIGGDEVNGKAWKNNPHILAFMKQHGMKSTADLQTYFSKRVVPLVEKHGKKVIGWDEVLQPGLPTGAVIQSWRGQRSLAQAAQQGYMGILSAGYYLDLMHPASQHYAVDPLEGATANLTSDEKARILGGEACMWVEFATPENVDTRIWPRMAAIAERLWSPENVKDVDSMYRRLAITSRWLDSAGITHRTAHYTMLERLTGLRPAGSLEMLDSVLEPVKGYAREETHRNYSSTTPLNRLVDSTPPESNEAREFTKLVADPAANQEAIRKLLTKWRDNKSQLLPLMQNSALLQEDIPLADDVSTLAAAGLQALDYISSGKPAPESWVTEQRALIGRARKPRAELLIMIAPALQTLVDDAAKISQ
ncbi:MAG TPA: family 20 glycosylhydrolase [Terriglobia bacterium]|nr:family 20 glycosylhydrolase [Terriglobia bacterium]